MFYRVRRLVQRGRVFRKNVSSIMPETNFLFILRIVSFSRLLLSSLCSGKNRPQMLSTTANPSSSLLPSTDTAVLSEFMSRLLNLFWCSRDRSWCFKIASSLIRGFFCVPTPEVISSLSSLSYSTWVNIRDEYDQAISGTYSALTCWSCSLANSNQKMNSCWAVEICERNFVSSLIHISFATFNCAHCLWNHWKAFELLCYKFPSCNRQLQFGERERAIPRSPPVVKMVTEALALPPSRQFWNRFQKSVFQLLVL